MSEDGLVSYLLFPVAFWIGGVVDSFSADVTALVNLRSIASTLGAALLGWAFYFMLVLIRA